MRKAVVPIIVIFIFAISFFAWYKISHRIIAPVVSEKNIPQYDIIGYSVEGRKIEAYTYGSSTTRLVFVGGIHGGYEWNSVLLAYKFIDYLSATSTIIPANLSITVIPSANPDGVFKVIGKEGRFSVIDVGGITKEASAVGRFNAHQVDLNRNFGCNWQATSTWQSKIVSAGTNVFSEPEALAIRDFVSKNKPTAMIFWHSQSNAVYASQCNNGVLPATINLMNTYAIAADYPAVKSFDSYAITGAVEDWLASVGVPAITVELKTHEAVEWDKNLAGIKAVLEYYKLRN
jgi:predicted deacylase